MNTLHASAFFIHVAAAAALQLSAGARAEEPKSLKDDFARFDRAYVPALALTKMGTQEASAKAMTRLRAEWSSFLAKNTEAIREDERWQNDLARVGEAIASADKHLDEGQQLDAHESLEEIREILLGTRRRNGITYYLDYLTDFHTTMEDIVQTVTAAQPGELSAEMLGKLRRDTKQAIRQWAKVKAAPVDATRFQLNKQKAAQRLQLLEAETKALKRLSEALNRDDQAEIISSAKAIKPMFAKSFMLFGSFPGGKAP